MDQTSNRCGNCRFSEPTGTAGYGLCRVNPPGPVPYTEYREGREVALAVTGWPQVNLFQDWCGEWEGLRDENDLVERDAGDREAAEIQASPTYGQLIPKDADLDLLCGQMWRQPGKKAGYIEWRCGRLKHHAGECSPSDPKDPIRCGKLISFSEQVGPRAFSWKVSCILPKGHSGSCSDIVETGQGDPTPETSRLDKPQPIGLVKPPDPLDKVRSAVRTLTAAAAERDDYMLDELAEALSAIEGILSRLTARIGG